MISSTGVGSESMAVYLKGNKPCQSAVTRTGNEGQADFIEDEEACHEYRGACTRLDSL